MIKRGGVELFRGSKRGLSPLIATVLLIAFAVAMGAMIMNWSSSMGDAPGKPDCSGIKLVMNPVVCYKDNLIKMNLKNDGVMVEELKVKIADDNTENELALKNSRMRRGDSLDKEIPFVKNGKASVQIIPSIEYKGDVVPCDKPAIDIPDVTQCAG